MVFAWMEEVEGECGEERPPSPFLARIQKRLFAGISGRRGKIESLEKRKKKGKEECVCGRGLFASEKDAI